MFEKLRKQSDKEDFFEDDFSEDEFLYEEYEIEAEEDDEDEEWEEDEDVFEEIECARRSPYTHEIKLILLEAVLLIVIAVSVMGFQHWKNDPKRIAEKYVAGSVKGEWNDIFKYLYFRDSEGEFLSKKMFVSAQELNFDSTDVIRSKTKKVKDISKNNTLYQVDYVKNEENFTKEVPLIQVNGKWKIDGDKELIKKNVQIRVPKDSVVFYDKVELDRKYIAAAEGGIDTYELPEVIDGMHYIEVEKQDMEKAERLVQLNPEEPVDITLKYSQEFLKKAGIQAQADIAEEYKKAEIGRTVFVSLNLTGNRITARTTGNNDEHIEVVVESQYEYKYKPGKYYNRVRTEIGSVRNVITYSYDGTGFKIEKKDVNSSFLKKR